MMSPTGRVVVRWIRKPTFARATVTGQNVASRSGNCESRASKGEGDVSKALGHVEKAGLDTKLIVSVLVVATAPPPGSRCSIVIDKRLQSCRGIRAEDSR